MRCIRVNYGDCAFIEIRQFSDKLTKAKVPAAATFYLRKGGENPHVRVSSAMTGSEIHKRLGQERRQL